MRGERGRGWAWGVVLALMVTGAARAQEGGSEGERAAIAAVRSKATAQSVGALRSYPGEESARALLEVIERSTSRSARSAACEVLVSYFRGTVEAELREALGASLAGLARDGSLEREAREGAMEALVERRLREPAFSAGGEILDLAISEDPNDDGARRIARGVIEACLARRPGQIEELARHEHASVRTAAEAQIRAWRRLHESMPYEDIALLLEWKEARLSSVKREIGVTEAAIRRKPDEKDYTAWGFREAPSKKLERLKRLERELRRAEIISFAAHPITVYQDAMLEIAEGERRALRRVEGAYEPRVPIEITFDEFEWQQVAGGSFDQVKVGESSFVIDFDEILGPKPPPTEEQVAALMRPDSSHRAAMAMARRSIEELYRLSPGTVELALAHFCKVHGVRPEQVLRLPERR